MNAQAPPAKPGWYPDPDQPETQRYWDGNEWTDQRAPARSSGISGIQLPVALALIGAAIAVIATFLPQIEASEVTTEIKDNSLVQNGDGIFILIAAVAGGIAAYTGRDGPRRRALIPILAGLLILVIAIYDGTGDRLQLTGTNTEDLNLTDALDALAGEQGSPGIGIYAAGLGGALLALGGFLLRRDVPSAPEA